MNTLSYHSSQELKDKAVKAAIHHRNADMLMAGTYGEVGDHFQGCSVGCDAFDIKGKVLDVEIHATTAEYFGFPEWLERLRDTLFEGLPEPDRFDFHVQLKEAIPVGVDLDPVRHLLAIKRMDRLIKLQEESAEYDTSNVIAALKTVKQCHEAEIGGNACDWSAARSAAWSAARSAARSAAWSAARSAAESAAWSAARSAAWSAARSAAWSAAESAAWSAAWSAARSAAWSAAYKQERDDLIDILKGIVA